MIVRLFLVFVRITGNQIKQRKAVQMVDDRFHISGMEFLENVLDVRAQGGELDETTLADILATHTMLKIQQNINFRTRQRLHNIQYIQQTGLPLANAHEFVFSLLHCLSARLTYHDSLPSRYERLHAGGMSSAGNQLHRIGRQ